MTNFLKIRWRENSKLYFEAKILNFLEPKKQDYSLMVGLKNIFSDAGLKASVVKFLSSIWRCGSATAERILLSMAAEWRHRFTAIKRLQSKSPAQVSMEQWASHSLWHRFNQSFWHLNNKLRMEKHLRPWNQLMWCCDLTCVMLLLFKWLFKVICGHSFMWTWRLN